MTKTIDEFASCEEAYGKGLCPITKKNIKVTDVIPLYRRYCRYCEYNKVERQTYEIYRGGIDE